jgi:hypothetical protein
LKQTVTAGTRKLQAKWTLEAAQDLGSQHGLNLEAEITAALAAISETASEVDSEGWDTSYPLAQAEAGADFANNQLDESSSTNNVARGLSRLWAASIAVFLMKAAPE